MLIGWMEPRRAADAASRGGMGSDRQCRFRLSHSVGWAVMLSVAIALVTAHHSANRALAAGHTAGLSGASRDALMADVDDDTVADPLDLPPFTLRAAASLWLPSIGGDLEVGDSGTPKTALNFETAFGIDDNEPTPGLEVHLEFPEGRPLERWRFGIEAWAYDAESTDVIGQDIIFGGVTAPAGSGVRNDFEINNLQINVGYDLFGDLAGNPGDAADMRVFAIAGVRGLNIDHRVTEAGGGVGPGGTTWVDYDEWLGVVEAGVLVDLHVAPEDLALPGLFDVRTGLMAGTGLLTDADVGTFSIEAAVTWRPSRTVGVTFGYRHLDFAVEDDSVDTTYRMKDARLAGAFFNVAVEF